MEKEKQTKAKAEDVSFQKGKKSTGLKKYKIPARKARELFNVYKDVFKEKYGSGIKQIERCSCDGFRAVIVKEYYENNPIFMFVFQTVKKSAFVTLSKTHKVNYQESFDFFNKIQDLFTEQEKKEIFNSENIFLDLDEHLKEKG